MGARCIHPAPHEVGLSRGRCLFLVRSNGRAFLRRQRAHDGTQVGEAGRGRGGGGRDVIEAAVNKHCDRGNCIKGGAQAPELRWVHLGSTCG